MFQCYHVKERDGAIFKPVTMGKATRLSCGQLLHVHFVVGNELLTLGSAIICACLLSAALQTIALPHRTEGFV